MRPLGAIDAPILRDINSLCADMPESLRFNFV
jgi:hypothetical protein